MLGNMAEEALPNGFVENSISGSNPPVPKKKRNLPGTPDPEAEVIALSPKTLMATNRFLCEICGKGFQRDQNLQLHRRGHNLPWKLKQRSSKEPRKRVYVCPEKSCVHNHPSRALGDLTGIKKHFCRKHGEKKWKCEKCSKRYAVQSDWKAHSKTCGTREYKCDCGTIFSRRDSFITHRAFCDALAEETARVNAVSNMNNVVAAGNMSYHFIGPTMAQNFSSIFKPISCNDDAVNPTTTSQGLPLWMSQGIFQGQEAAIFGDPLISCSNPPPSDHYTQQNWVFGSKLSSSNEQRDVKEGTGTQLLSVPSLYSTQHQTHQTPFANMSATALLQKAAQIGATSTDPLFLGSFGLKGNEGEVVYGSNTTLTSLGNDVEKSVDDVLLIHPAKRRQIQNDQDGGGGQTRDFLGVGVQPVCHPPSINGWI